MCLTLYVTRILCYNTILQQIMNSPLLSYLKDKLLLASCAILAIIYHTSIYVYDA